jgi:isoleucyl-tRNA synthetase
MDYQKTLNLPQTEFAMKANLAQKEPALLDKWAKDGLYAQMRQVQSGRKKFILHDGPPYANGHIHIGHALNKILKDMIVKFRALEGFDSFYLPGWDCHGLPIEHQLLKELKQHKSQVDCVDFRQKAQDYAMKFVGIQREEFKRLGIFGEWDNPYLTLKPEYGYWILKSLGKLHKEGYVYRGLKPVNWCYTCETALAEAEVEYENHTSPSVYVKFEIKNKEQLAGLPNKKVSLLIWTTTPWTLLANVAVAVHPDFSYRLLDVGEEILIIERGLSEKVLNKAGITNAKELKKVRGQELTNLRYVHPFGVQTNCCVVTANYVTTEDGTGLVHTAPGHGQDDFKTGQKHKLDVLMPVNNRGVYTKDAGIYEGEHVSKVNPKIIEDLKAQGLLLLQENIQHSYPHCWRCKSPIIFRATKQWFLSIDHKDLRSKLEDAVNNNVQWIPPAGRERILGMVKSRPDWCLSRQRFWGVPIPALECAGCGEFKLYQEVIEHFADIVRKEGSTAWFKKDVKDLIPSGFKCKDCGSSDFKKSEDILDVWFDSGVSSQAVVRGMLQADLPADLYLEGSDQHRGWFQSSLIPAVAIEGKPPFSAVLTHGFVVDGQGHKMSKSLGNVVAPQDIIKQSGADILRLWVASSSYHDDIRISKEILERLIDAYRKIRNTFRYILGNVNGFDPDQNLLTYVQLLDLDRYALARFAGYMEEIKAAYQEYEFARVYKAIYAFCNEDLSSFYLDILKDRLYTSPSNSIERRSAQTVLYHILNLLVRALSPLLSFTAEEIYMSMPKGSSLAKFGSVHLLTWIDPPKEWNNPSLVERFQPLVDFRPHVLKALDEMRKNGEIGSSLEAQVLIQTSSVRDWEYFQSMKDLLEQSFIVSKVHLEKVQDIATGVSEAFAKTMIVVKKAEGQKCARCWNYKQDVGSSTEHPSLCGRCAHIVKESM